MSEKIPLGRAWLEATEYLHYNEFPESIAAIRALLLMLLDAATPLQRDMAGAWAAQQAFIRQQVEQLP